MLETMALLGMPVFYMEPAESPSGSRMLAFSRKGIPYNRIQIQAPPGITAFGAQLSIERGIPAPSLQYWQRKVDEGTRSIKRYRPFQDNYGSYSRKTGVTFDDTGDKAARSYAKATLIGSDLGDNIRERSVIRTLQDMRGFSSGDLETITSRVEAAFRT
jgi:hypothetical protein